MWQSLRQYSFKVQLFQLQSEKMSIYLENQIDETTKIELVWRMDMRLHPESNLENVK